jgi:hypothetical protein
MVHLRRQIGFPQVRAPISADSESSTRAETLVLALQIFSHSQIPNGEEDKVIISGVSVSMGSIPF